MREKDLIDLGFERQDVGTDNHFYYYTLDVEDLCLITSANDEVELYDEWKVFIFDYNGFEFTKLEKLKSFIDILKSAVKK
jgi:hypothetical protein